MVQPPFKPLKMNGKRKRGVLREANFVSRDATVAQAISNENLFQVIALLGERETG